MRRKQVLIRHFVETAATRTADIEILCVMFDLQDEPDAFTVYSHVYDRRCCGNFDLDV